MSLIESLTLTVGPALAKSVLRLWLLNHGVVSDLSASLIDLLKEKCSDAIAQHRGERQFEAIGEKVAESLLPLFQNEVANITENGRKAVAMMVAETLNRAAIQPTLLLDRHLDPIALSDYLLDANETATRDFSEVESELYRRTIFEVSQAIVDIASQLPHFTERTIAEILKRENQLLGIALEILQEVRRIREGSEKLNSGTDESRFETEYRRAVVRRLDELELFGVDASSASRRHRLSVAYITLSVLRKATKRTAEKELFEPSLDKKAQALRKRDASRKTQSKDIMPVDIALARSNRLLIRGLAGSGKTTLLQWIAVRAASQTFEGELTPLNNAVPFFIRLRQCVDQTFPPPEEFPKLIAPVIAAMMPPNWVHQQLKTGRAIVLIDGVDEVPESLRHTVREGLMQLVEAFPETKFIITSRPSAVEEGWLNREHFHDAELQPMQMPDILEFIDHWHDAVRDELQEETEKVALVPLAENLRKVIRRNNRISDLATSPLLCAMICALHRDRRKQIPSDRVDLYEACVRMLIERRDLERGIGLTDYLTLSYRQKTALLRDLAYWFLNNGWSSVTVDRAESRIKLKLESIPGIPRETASSEVLRLFLDRSGLLRKPVPEQVDFTHRTFQEFLAAQAALSEGDIGALVNNAHDDQWRETVILAAGLAITKTREDIIRGIIRRGDRDKKRKHQLYLVAMACIDASVELSNDLKALAQARLSKIVPPRDRKAAETLITAGDLAVPYLTDFVNAEPEITSLCIQTLSTIGGPAALDAIEEYVLKMKEPPIEDLVRAWSSFEGREYAQRVLAVTLANTLELKLGSESLLSGFEYLQHLTSLQIVDNFRLRNLHPLMPLTNLATLKLQHCEYFYDLNGLDQLSKITELDLQGTNVSSIPQVCALRLLTKLNLGGCKLDNIEAIVGLSNLSVLRLNGCNQISDFRPLAKLPRLLALDLGGCSELTDLQFIEEIKTLEVLSLNGCRKLVDLTRLKGLSRLKRLVLRGCHSLNDIGPLTVLKDIEVLDLSFADGIDDLSPLKKLPKLKTLYLFSNLETFQRRIPIELQALVYRNKPFRRHPLSFE
jgi:hypothetical protein